MLALDWKRCIVLALVAVSGVGLLASCGPPQPQSAVASPRAIAVKVVPATTGSISVATAYATIVEARDQVDLVPLTTGRVDKLTVDIGSDVRKGQIIAELSHGTLDAQLQQAWEHAAASLKSNL